MKDMNRMLRWIPDPLALIFYILLFTWLLTWIVPAGSFERAEIGGRMMVLANTYHQVEGGRLSILDAFFAIPKGMVASASVIFIAFIAGGLFHILSATQMLENAVGSMVGKLGQERGTLLVWISTFAFGLLGIAVGYENNIALVPIAVLLGLAIGGDVMVGLGIAIGGIGFGFATSPINPYTVGVSHQIAQLEIFSGAVVRSVFALIILATVAHHNARYLVKIRRNPQASLSLGVSTAGLTLAKPIKDYRMGGKDWTILGIFLAGLALMLFGVFQYKWYINEIAGIFLLIAVLSGLVVGMRPNEIAQKFGEGAAAVSKGALLIGFARGIQVLLEQGAIGDTIINSLASGLNDFPVTVSTILMSIVHGIINFFIPSGSGQAVATMPIMIPLSDLIGMTRQVAVSAFQVGDGFTNMISPTSGGTLAMLALVGMPYDRWVKFFFPLLLKAYLLAWVFLALVANIGWS